MLTHICICTPVTRNWRIKPYVGGTSSPLPSLSPPFLPSIYRILTDNRQLHNPRPPLHRHRRNERNLRPGDNDHPDPPPNQTPSPAAPQTNPRGHVLLRNLHHDLHDPARILLPEIANHAEHRAGLGESRVLRCCYRRFVTGD